MMHRRLHSVEAEKEKTMTYEIENKALSDGWFASEWHHRPKEEPMESPLIPLELETATFDAARFALDNETASAAGFSCPSLAHLGDTYTTRMCLYELAQQIIDDSPGADPVESGFWEFVNMQIVTRFYDPRGVILAIRDDKWVGLSITTEHHGEGYMLSEHLWVAPAYRRFGLAISMTTQAIRFARDRRVPKVRAKAGRGDNALLSLYRTLGFTEPS
jgi:ribosomal protein S18 acetylase RimI-like enzyme